MRWRLTSDNNSCARGLSANAGYRARCGSKCREMGVADSSHHRDAGRVAQGQSGKDAARRTLPMLVVALLLLPAMGLLMIAMDRIEDLLNEEARPATGRRVRHLRLVPTG